MQSQWGRKLTCIPNIVQQNNIYIDQNFRPKSWNMTNLELTRVQLTHSSVVVIGF